MNAIVFGLGCAMSEIACTMLAAYAVAGDRTANVRWYPLVKMVSSAPELSAITCLLRSITAAAAPVVADPYGPRISFTPPSLNWSTSCPAVSGFEVSSWYLMSSVSLVPPTVTPPLPLTTLLQTSYPSWVSLPSRASEPVSEIDAPRVSVPVGVLLVASPFEPQPAMPKASAAAAATASIRVLMSCSTFRRVRRNRRDCDAGHIDIRVVLDESRSFGRPRVRSGPARGWVIDGNPTVGALRPRVLRRPDEPAVPPPAVPPA